MTPEFSSEGARQLAATGLSARKVAAEIGVSNTTVSDWLRGKRLPSAKQRGQLHELYGVRPAAWDEAPREPNEAPVVAAVARSAVEAADDLSHAKAVDRLRAQLRRIDALRAEPGLSPRARLDLEKAEVAVNRELQRAEGATLSEAAILRSGPWRRIEEAIESLGDTHPLAFLELAAKIADLAASDNEAFTGGGDEMRARIAKIRSKHPEIVAAIERNERELSRRLAARG